MQVFIKRVGEKAIFSEFLNFSGSTILAIYPKMNCTIMQEIFGLGTGHGEIEVLESLAVAALQGCDGQIKKHVQDLVEPIASSGLTEHKVEEIQM